MAVFLSSAHRAVTPNLVTDGLEDRAEGLMGASLGRRAAHEVPSKWIKARSTVDGYKARKCRATHTLQNN